MLSSNNDFSVFYDIHVVLGEYGNTIIIAQLSDGNQGPRFEVVKDVSDVCFLGEFGRKGDCCASRRLDVGTIFYLYRRARQCRLDFCAILPGGRE